MGHERDECETADCGITGQQISRTEDKQNRLPEEQHIRKIQGSQSEPLRRVRVAWKATSSFPHACASYNSAGDIPPVL